MPSLRIFRIEFDRPDGTYVPGDLLTGRIRIDLAEAKKVRGLKVSAKGECKTHWTRQREEKDSNGRTHTRTDHYHGSEEYFHSSYNILLSSSGKGDVHLPAGQNVYQFNFQLPQSIPCSFEHHYGYIRYTVKAVIDRPWKFDHECKAAFTVVTPLDLNSHLVQCVGIDEEIDKNFTCFCCFNVGTMKLNISFPSAGYVPGQTIETKVAFENGSSSVDVTRVCVALAQKLKFRTSMPPDSMTSNSDMKKISKTGPFEKKERLELRLPVPPIPPSRLEYCGLIDLNYSLDVSVHVSGWHCSTQRSYPIVIGTIPLRPMPSAPGVYAVGQPSTNIVDQTMPMPMPTAPYLDQAGGSSTDNPPLVAPIGFNIPDQANVGWDMPPPSYEECMTRADSIKEKDETTYVYGASQPFAPRYPVFNFPTPQLPPN